jgi:hypothetical protein
VSGSGLLGDKLDLDSRCLHQPHRLDLAIIEAVMVWPDDANARSRAIQTSKVEFLRENINYRNHWSEINEVSLFEFVAGAEPIENIHAEVKKHFVRGYASGFILRETIARIQIGAPDATIGASISKMSEIYRRKKDGSGWPLDKKTINNTIWPKYKPVSHFWAAAINYKLQHRSEPFPCEKSRLAQFLEEAEAWRTLGASLRTAKASGPILQGVKSITVPFSLPRGRLALMAASR